MLGWSSSAKSSRLTHKLCNCEDKHYLYLIVSSWFSDLKFRTTQVRKQLILLSREVFLHSLFFKSSVQTCIFHQALPVKHIPSICSKILHNFYKWKCYNNSWNILIVLMHNGRNSSTFLYHQLYLLSQLSQFEFPQEFEKSSEILQRESAWSLTA